MEGETEETLLLRAKMGASMEDQHKRKKKRKREHHEKEEEAAEQRERKKDKKKKKKKHRHREAEEASSPGSSGKQQQSGAGGAAAAAAPSTTATSSGSVPSALPEKTQAGLTAFTAAAKAQFPELTAAQWTQLEELGALVQEWNGKVNVISRKDIENVLPRHVLPCMGIAKLLHRAPPGTRLMDVGTGGGFPGLPLAICCPQVRFLLVDSIGKKIKVVGDMAKRLGLTNVEARHTRVEDVRERFNFVTGRSVTAMPRFVGWVREKFVAAPLAASAALASEEGEAREVTGGILYIKGGISDANQEEDLGGWVPTARYPIARLIGGGEAVYEADPNPKSVLYFDLACLRKGPRKG